MTNDQAKNAMFDGVPVVYDGIEYKCISAMIYRVKRVKNKKYIIPSVELTDKTAAHSVIIVPINKVNFP